MTERDAYNRRLVIAIFVGLLLLFPILGMLL